MENARYGDSLQNNFKISRQCTHQNVTINTASEKRTRDAAGNKKILLEVEICAKSSYL